MGVDGREFEASNLDQFNPKKELSARDRVSLHFDVHHEERLCTIFGCMSPSAPLEHI